ncbi:hypothetical protein ACJIZ3_016609 [Penstemon smallii]|uniref:Pectinesterase inhibitor domain-containing protein n=1 Tax=Penstemon smallii TaxID=265156 RepID=A0ABD3ST64_9LAMI
MSYKFLFLFALLFGLSHCPALITADPHVSRLHLTHKISKVSGEPLVQNACRGVGDYESECILKLQSAPPHQKADGNGLAFFTLRFVEDHAANLSDAIKKTGTNPDLYPLLQSAISDCLVQYNPLDDLVENAINAVLANAYSDAIQFIEAAISNTEECDSELKTSYLEEKAEGKQGEEVQFAARDLKENNMFLKNMLSAALNIVKAN